MTKIIIVQDPDFRQRTLESVFVYDNRMRATFHDTKADQLWQCNLI